MSLADQGARSIDSATLSFDLVAAVPQRLKIAVVARKKNKGKKVEDDKASDGGGIALTKEPIQLLEFPSHATSLELDIASDRGIVRLNSLVREALQQVEGANRLSIFVKAYEGVGAINASNTQLVLVYDAPDAIKGDTPVSADLGVEPTPKKEGTDRASD